MGHAIQEKLPVQYPAGTAFRREAMITANTKYQSIWFNIITKNSIFWINKYFVGYDFNTNCLTIGTSNLISKKANLFIKEINIFRSYHKHFWHTVLLFFVTNINIILRHIIWTAYWIYLHQSQWISFYLVAHLILWLISFESCWGP